MKRFKNILYVFEPSVDQDASVARAIAVARNNQARLTLLAVLPEQVTGIGFSSAGDREREVESVRMAQQRQQMEALLAPHQESLETAFDIRRGTPFLEVIRAVLRDGHDLVMKPAEDPDWMERLFGSDDMHLLRKCPVPVWLLKPQAPQQYSCVAAALDFNPQQADDSTQASLNDLILSLASGVALTEFAQLHLLHAWDAPEAALVRVWADDPDLSEMTIVEEERRRHSAGLKKLDARLAELLGAETYGYLEPQSHLVMGAARKAIPSMVKNLQVDLLVMGTVARTGIPGLLIGNTAESLFDQLQCSVLAVKPPGFQTPVTLE